MIGLAASVSAMGQYNSSIAIQNSTNCFPGMNKAVVLEIQVNVSGKGSSLSSMQFNTNGTNAVSNIESARLFYSNGSDFNNPLPDNNVVGTTVTSPNGSFSFSGLNINLSDGVNNFFLVYDLPYGATLGDSVDAECTGLTVDANGETPSTTAPAGSRLIVKNTSYSYCARPAASPLNYQIGISRLKIGSKDFITQIPQPAGSLLTLDTVFGLIKDVTYDLGYSVGSINPQNELIYVDLNNDGFFEQSETVFSGTTAAGNTTTGTWKIDCAVENGIHRMRIASDLTMPNNSCSGNGYGSTLEALVDFSDAPAAVANFDIPLEAYRGAFVDFKNTSEGLGYNYRWDYENDGTVDATTVDGKGQYNSAGSKTVELAMSAVFCGTSRRDSTTKSITIINPQAVPTSEFIANRNVTNQTLEVKFRDLSSNGANRWHWKITPENVNGSPAYVYINGTDSTSQNPEVLFMELGNYNVEFFSENILGAGNYVTKPDYISVISINDICTLPSTDQESGFLADEGGVYGNYASYAGTGKLCSFLIQPSCAASISFDFLDFDMSSFQITACYITGSNPPVLQPGDNVKIYDGVDNTGTPLHTAAGFPNGFSNGPNNALLTTLPSTVTANSGSMYIEYFVNCAGNGRGFLGEWSSTAKTLPTPTASFEGPDTVYTDAPYIFTNTSTGDFDESVWDFDNDGLNDYSGVDAEVIFDNAGTQTVKLSVGRCGNADDITKDITVLSPTSAPQVDFRANRTSGIVLDTLRFFDISANGPNAWKWSISPAADITYVNGTNATSRNPFVKFNKTGMFEVKLWASNSLGADSLVRTAYVGIYNYCIPNSVNLSADIGMSYIEFGQISNSSEVGVSSYTRYLNNTTVQQGATEQIILERKSNFNNVNYKVWIDFNKNGSFNDAGEEVFVENSTSALQVIGNIRIPKTAPLGNTRMRIGANAEANPNLSCGPNQFGEFEDYVITIEKDDTKPLITLNGQSIYKMEQGYAYADAGAVAMDNADGDITSLIVVRNNVNTAVTGEYWVSYNVTDSAGNRADSVVRNVIVQPDGSGPEITLTAGDTIIHEVNTTWTEPGYAALDFVDGVISNVNVSGTVNSTELGTYYITYSATDLQGNSNTAQRVVIVKDQTAPVLTLNGMDPFVLDYGTPFADPGVSISDNYYTDLTYQRTGNINIKTIGNVVLTYDVKDPSGNVALSITRTVEVRDISAPKITLNGSDTMRLDVFTKYIETGAFVSDNHTKGLQAVVSGTVNSNILGNYSITYTATDSSGNISTKTRVVQVVDREAPVIVLKGSSLMQINRFAPVTDPGVTIQDNYDSDASLQADLVVINGVVNDIEGLYQICYQVNDKSGNASAQVCRLVEVGPADPNGMENMEDAVIAVYPNPTHGKFQIELPNGMQAETIKIYNATGALVKEVIVQNAQFNYEVSMEQATPGIYYVVVNSNGKSFSTKMSYIK